MSPQKDEEEVLEELEEEGEEVEEEIEEQEAPGETVIEMGEDELFERFHSFISSLGEPVKPAAPPKPKPAAKPPVKPVTKPPVKPQPKPTKKEEKPNGSQKKKFRVRLFRTF